MAKEKEEMPKDEEKLCGKKYSRTDEKEKESSWKKRTVFWEEGVGENVNNDEF